MNHAVKQQILKSADAVELREVALQHGMAALRTNGAQLVLRGITTSAEVLRVTRGYEGD